MKKMLNKVLSAMGLKKYNSQKISTSPHTNYQGYVLAARLEAEGVHHGDEAIADIDRVRINEGSISFCPVENVKVKLLTKIGDRGSLPGFVTTEAFEPKFIGKKLRDGHYKVKNVKIFSNGTIQLISTPDTELEYIMA